MAKRPKASKSKPPSMYDVARVAGVSQTTVSFVVNNAPNTTIPQETRDRVWAAIEELGWQPNEMARGLRMRMSHTIGVTWSGWLGRRRIGSETLVLESIAVPRALSMNSTLRS